MHWLAQRLLRLNFLVEIKVKHVKMVFLSLSISHASIRWLWILHIFLGIGTITFILPLQLSDQVLDGFLSFQELQDVILQSEAVRLLSWAEK